MIGALEDRHRTPAARLKALFNELSSQADLLARYGCPTARSVPS